MGYLAVGIGGIVGAILRFLVSDLLTNHFYNFFPFGTLFVNLTGCFILGYFLGFARVFPMPNWLVLGFGTGVIGSYTTFSTFSNEVIFYFIENKIIAGIAYILASAIGGIKLVGVGFALAIAKDGK
ncbi:fluoride efflux transporter CrcB [Bacillus sp. V5-8f]|uniref:fluoride efflux transporter CrcB n=1 Tax=Bacillus sp. V5-8f TaxID=2053044 RepID=UPI000C75E944|nr:fluoride efflux transporter CrcB [Bacillus sp. V5-8f]PLT33366.1 fluoride efflux transporter CrcB [Bacillus sp. V5-8f]